MLLLKAIKWGQNRLGLLRLEQGQVSKLIVENDAIWTDAIQWL